MAFQVKNFFLQQYIVPTNTFYVANYDLIVSSCPFCEHNIILQSYLIDPRGEGEFMASQSASLGFASCIDALTMTLPAMEIAQIGSLFSGNF